MVKLKVWAEQAAGGEALEFGLASPVSAVKKHVSQLLNGVAPEDLAVVYCGRPFPADAVLGSFVGIEDTSTVHVMRMKKREGAAGGEAAGSSSSRGEEIESLVTSMQTALMDQHHKTLLFSILSNPDGLASLISATPGLKEDTVAQGILKDPYLIMHWLRDEKAEELIREHPSLLLACVQVMSTLHVEAAAHAPIVGEDLFDEDDGGVSDGEGDNAAPPAQQGQMITPEQLAAALATAAAATQMGGAGGARAGAAGGPSGTNTGQGPSQNLSGITPSMFQQAMAQAIGGQTDYSESMAQLNDMGFTDEAENRRALQATGGSFEAALEWIINERERGDMPLD